MTTDSPRAVEIARDYGIPCRASPDLASDMATVEPPCVTRLEAYEAEPISSPTSSCSSRETSRAGPRHRRPLVDLSCRHRGRLRPLRPPVACITRLVVRLHGDRMVPFRDNGIYRRQDLEPLFSLDGSVYAVTRGSLYTPPEHEEDYHAFLGHDRRAIVQAPEDTIDIDTPADMYRAEAAIRMRNEGGPGAPVPSRRRPILTGAVAYSYHERR